MEYLKFKLTSVNWNFRYNNNNNGTDTKEF